MELSSSSKDEEDLDVLRNENSFLKERIRQLEEENQQLKQTRNNNPNIVLETFEGAPLFRDRGEDYNATKTSGITLLSGDEVVPQDEQLNNGMSGNTIDSCDFGEVMLWGLLLALYL